MPKRKKSKQDGPSYHRDFKAPTKHQRQEAIGAFPCPPALAGPRLQMVSKAGQRLSSETTFAPADMDNPKLFQPTKRSETSFAIPKPRDDQDWLVCVPEEGQTFDDYTKFLMSRSGRMRPICNATRDDIVLLPLVEDGGWPNHGVPMGPLVELTKAYFRRPVRLLPPALLSPTGKKKSKATTAFHISFPTAKTTDRDVFEVTGRVDPTTGRTQYNVETLLSSLVNFRDDVPANLPAADGGPALATSSFCVMALTMADLYQTASDLFIAGLAAGGSKVAVFSFARYHPHIKIHPQSWHSYGYGAKAEDYSYFEGGPKTWDKQRKALVDNPPAFESLDDPFKAEFYRRCGKLLVHELMHLYGLGHCIFNRCIMMGTGHLVEDFAAPTNLCGVCLRKMQWRLGFDVVGRYAKLADVFMSLGMAKEEKWTRRQVEKLSICQPTPPS